MKKIKNWLDDYMFFDNILGQAIANHEIQNLPGGYIYDDGFINLTADPEIPIKGLIILGTNKSYSSITEFSEEEKLKIFKISNILLTVLHNIGFSEIIQFQDEGSKGQFHIWFLPKHDWTYKFNYNFNDIINYSKTVLNVTDEYKSSLLECITSIKNDFQKQKI